SRRSPRRGAPPRRPTAAARPGRRRSAPPSSSRTRPGRRPPPGRRRTTAGRRGDGGRGRSWFLLGAGRSRGGDLLDAPAGNDLRREVPLGEFAGRGTVGLVVGPDRLDRGGRLLRRAERQQPAADGEVPAE